MRESEDWPLSRLRRSFDHVFEWPDVDAIMVTTIGCVEGRGADGGSAALPRAANASGGSDGDARGTLDTVDDGPGRQAGARQRSHARGAAGARRRTGLPEALRAGVLYPARPVGLGRCAGARVDQRSWRDPRAGGTVNGGRSGQPPPGLAWAPPRPGRSPPRAARAWRARPRGRGGAAAF